MGILDQVLAGAMGSNEQGGSSPLMPALLALLSSAGSGGGGLGSLLGGTTGGPNARTGGGMGGLGALVESFQRSGHGDVLESWVGPGRNRDISPSQLGEAIGRGKVDDLSRQTGMPRGDLLSELSRILPGVVDQMTPQGRRPNDEELSKW